MANTPSNGKHDPDYDPAIYGEPEDDDPFPKRQAAMPADHAIDQVVEDICFQRGLDRHAIKALMSELRAIIQELIDRGDMLIDAQTIREAFSILQQRTARRREAADLMEGKA